MNRLLLITAGFPYGESEHSFIYTELMELCRHFEVSILSINPESDQIKYTIPPSVQLQSLDLARCEKNVFFRLIQLLRPGTIEEIRKSLSDKKKKNYIKRIGTILTYVYYADLVLKKITTIEIYSQRYFDCIYTFWCTPATLASVRYKKRSVNSARNVRVISRFHGYDLYNERLTGGWQCFRDEIAEWCDKLVFVSGQGERYFEENWHTDDRKCLVSYLGCRDLMLERKDIIKPSKREKTDGSGGFNRSLNIVSCSSLIPLKRVDLIIQALGEIDESIYVKWYHFGDGPLEEEIVNLAHSTLDPRKNIEWELCGRVDNELISAEYQKKKIQLFISTSSSEGLPVSIVEAMSLGLPVIATDVGGVSEAVIDGSTGFLLKSEPTPMEVGVALCRFARMDDNARSILNNNARKRWEECFNASLNSIQFCEMVEQLLND